MLPWESKVLHLLGSSGRRRGWLVSCLEEQRARRGPAGPSRVPPAQGRAGRQQRAPGGDVFLPITSPHLSALSLFPEVTRDACQPLAREQKGDAWDQR